MTPQEWIEARKREAQAIRDSRILFFATTGTMAEMSKRIWTDGELSKGGKLTYAEDYEVYIYKPPFPRKPDGKGKTGRKIKGQWAPSYLAAKASQGRQDLPFELTGDMRIGWLGGPQPTPSEVNPLLVEIRMPDKEWKKAQGLAKQKGEFLLLTDGERSSHVRRIIDLYTQL
jgi:hypothetical protein